MNASYRMKPPSDIRAILHRAIDGMLNKIELSPQSSTTESIGADAIYIEKLMNDFVRSVNEKVS